MEKTINIEKAEEINITINGMKELQNLEDYLIDINSSLNDIADAFKEWGDIDTSVISKTFDAITIGAASIQILTTNIKGFGTVGSILAEGFGAFLKLSAAIPIAVVAALALVTGLSYMLSPLADANKLIDEQTEAWNKLAEAQNNKAVSDLAQIAHAEQLGDKLTALTDGNNKVTGSMQEAQGLVNQMNELMGTNIQITEDGTISYGDSAQSLEKLIEQKKALAVIEALEPMYKQAIVQAYELENKTRENNMEIQQLETDMATSTNEYEIQMYANRIAQLQEANAKYQDEKNDNLTKINDIDTLYREQATGSYDKILTQVGLTNDNLLEESKKTGYYTPLGFSNGVKSGMDDKEESIKEDMGEPISWFAELFDINSPSKVFKGFGKNIVDGLNNGINETVPDTEKEMGKMRGKVTGAFDGADLPRLKGKFHDESVAGALRKVAELFGFSTTPRLDIIKAASGGLIEPGQFFLAREAGPELVGSFGSRTAVMNNNQIVESVSTGVYKAVTDALRGKGGANNGTIHVSLNVDSKTLGEVYTNYHNSIVRQTGVSPLLV